MNLTLTLVQTPLHWESPAANRAMLEEKLSDLEQPTDVIVLPEMFTTGFSMAAPQLAEPMNLHTFKWLHQMASVTGAAVTGSYIVSENGRYYNRLLWMQPDGQYFAYDKKHLFGLAGEGESYQAGEQRLVVEWRGWRICPLICYDLRFPVWSRNTYDNGIASYDLLLYVANWPQPRRLAWQTLLRARAIENQSYVAGVNRVGTDAKGHAYTGDSAAINYLGETLWDGGDAETTATLTLNREALLDFRQRFPFHQDADAFRFI